MGHGTDARLIPDKSLDPETAKLAYAWMNSDNTPAPLIQFSMPVNGTYYVVEAVPSSKARIMAVVSAYMRSDTKKGQQPQSSAIAAGNPTVSETPEAPLDRIGAAKYRIAPSNTTVNPSGMSAFFNGNGVRHIIRRHGNARAETAKNQIAVTPDDIALIPHVLSEPDTVVLSDHLDDKGRQVLLFEKQIGNQYVVVEAVSYGRHALETDTMYIKKTKNSQDTGNNAGGEPDPVTNARSVPSQSSSIHNITSELPSVNPSGQRIDAETEKDTAGSLTGGRG